ncbi:MAG: LacI family DNA-binding transcriptional regulator [Ignavibacteriaceae bacterium]|nr:LacI family DNA-binding transcriptional regulator [Ignavibacteriaceae bacterium]
MAITLEEIAKITGFSASTVSRVLTKQSKKYRISQVTEKVIIKKAKELGYRPNDLARGLRLKKTHLIGLMVPDISNPFFSYLTHIIQKKVYMNGYSLIVANTNEDINTEIEQLEIFRRKGIDGYIIMPVGTKYEHLADLIEHNKPLVLLDRNIDELNVNCVVVDNYRGSYEAIQYLINAGHKRIAIIQGLQNTYTNNERVLGYKNALADNGIKIDEELIVGNDFRRENGFISTKMLLKLSNPPTAIFTFSDLITLGTLHACMEEKINIPDSLSVVVFDDIDFAPFLVTPLTAVRQPREMMGEVAVKLLIDEIKNKSQERKKKIILEPKLIIRKSVRDMILGGNANHLNTTMEYHYD